MCQSLSRIDRNRYCNQGDLVAKEDIYLEGMDAPIVLKGEYNFYNDYNTSKGIVHLNQRNNYLSAELNIATMSTQLQQEEDPQGNLTLLQRALHWCWPVSMVALDGTLTRQLASFATGSPAIP
jgi:hypothetical protein